MTKNIAIGENFALRNMHHYDTDLPNQREILEHQDHVDIRTFTTDSGEKWTQGVYGPQPSLKGLPGLSLEIGAGVTVAASSGAEAGVFPAGSLYPSSIFFPGGTPEEEANAMNFPPVNLMTGFESTDYVILSLPKFPLSKLVASESFIDFTSDEQGKFTGPLASVPLSATLTHLENEGNCEFRVQRSAFEASGVNLAQVTGVRFRIKGTSSATLVVGGLRLVSSKWNFTTLDYDNWNKRWRNVIPPTGNIGGIRNEIGNPNFDHDTVGSAPAWWSKYENHSPTVSTYAVGNEWSDNGTQAMRVKASLPNFAEAGIGTSTSKFIPVTPGLKYGLTCTTNAVVLNGCVMRMEVTYFSESLAQLSGASSDFSTVGIADGTISVKAPATAAFARIRLFLVNETGSTKSVDGWFDKISFFLGSHEYADGDTGGWKWTEAPGNSASEVITSKSAFAEQPIIWRSDSPPGTNDPRPVDAEMAVVFYTGSQFGKNTMSVNMRGISKAFLTQLDLENKDMGELDNHPQPDLGVSEFSARQMGDLEGVDVGELEDLDMSDIEQVDNPAFDSWITFEMNWGATNTVKISNSYLPGYLMAFPLLASKAYYIFVCSLEDTTARARIYRLKEDFSINPNVVWDSTAIQDGGLFKRRKGRVGWSAKFEDNDSFIKSIRPRHTVFSEFRSSPLTSITPVTGAQMFANFTPNTQLWRNLEGGSKNTEISSTIMRDTARSTTGESYRIDMYNSPNQGFRSNILDFTDFSQAAVTFDLWYPSSLPGLKAKLVSVEGTEIPLTLPLIETDQWQKVTIPLSNEFVQTGEYRFVLEQPVEAPGTWWVDNVSIFERAMQWSARSVVDDPWTSNYAPWTDFHDVINTDLGGVLFPIRGTQLQLRAKALRQDATIAEPPKLKPKYAELGRLVWPENKPPAPRGPVSKFGIFSRVEGLEPEFMAVPDKGVYGVAVDSSAIYLGDTVGSGSIKKASLSGTGLTNIVAPAELAQAVWSDNEFVYWSHESETTQWAIGRAKTNGSSPNESFIVPSKANEGVVNGITADPIYLYLAFEDQFGQGSIARINKTTPASEGGPKMKFILMPEGVDVPSDVKANSNFIFWSTANNLWRAKLDGTATQLLVSLPGKQVIEAFTVTPSKIFWMQTNTLGVTHSYFIGQSKLDGTSANPELISLGKGSNLRLGGIASNPEFIYWSNKETKKVGRAKISKAGELTYEFVSSSEAGSSPVGIYQWSFGDGTTGSGPVVTHIYKAHGIFEVTLTVTDRNGLQSQATQELLVE